MGKLFESALDQAFVGQRGLIRGDAGLLDDRGGQGEADWCGAIVGLGRPICKGPDRYWGSSWGLVWSADLGSGLDSAGRVTENLGMEIQGRVQNGLVVLDGGVSLPEGASVSVLYPASSRAKPVVGKRRIQLPLVHCDQPGSVPLTSERIAEILDAEDAAP